MVINDEKQISKEYKPFLKAIKEDISEARLRSAQIVNHELTQLYWKIGERIVTAQKKDGWGKSIVLQLSRD